LVQGLNNFGIFYARQGRPLEAEPLLERAIPTAKALLEAAPDDAGSRNLFAVTWGNLAGVRMLLGQLDQAERDYREELALRLAGC
jgi:Tfp pilus assembly protein PilF